MNKKRKENLKTILLFCIMFFGINYVIYTYAILPKIVDLNEIKEEFARNGEIQEILKTKRAEKIRIEKEIEGLKPYVAQFDQVVLSQLDTIQIAYDYYTFSEEQGIVAKLLQIDLFNELQDDLLYGYNEITLTANLDEERLSDLLTNLMDASTQKVFLRSLKIEMMNGEILDNVGKANLYSSLDKKEVTHGDYIEDYIVATFVFKGYAQSVTGEGEKRVEYSFFQEQENHDTITDVFASKPDK